MMRMARKAPAFLVPTKETTFVAAGEDGGAPPPEGLEWEVRPGGMLVQRRNPEPDAAAAARPPAPTVRVRVKHGAAHYEICLSSQATFAELKKVLAERTGLHPQDQKVLFKGKEREPGAYLDISGVRDRSKVVLVEDPAARARRFLEMRRASKVEKAATAVSQISLDVDKLATKVAQVEAIASKGKRVAEADVIGLIEQLMNQLLKLDGVVADGDVKQQRRVQVRRVQNYVETLDGIKIKNSVARTDSRMPPQEKQDAHHHQYQHKEQVLQRVPQPPVVVTTNWETFDLLSGPPPPSTAPAAATASAIPIPRFEWELF